MQDIKKKYVVTRDSKLDDGTLTSDPIGIYETSKEAIRIAEEEYSSFSDEEAEEYAISVGEIMESDLAREGDWESYKKCDVILNLGANLI